MARLPMHAFSLRRPQKSHGTSRRPIITAALVAGGLVAVANVACGFAAGISGSRQRGRSSRMSLRAEEDGSTARDDQIKWLKSNMKVSQETEVDEADFSTPLDDVFSFFGGGGKKKREVASNDDFVDSSDEANYVTVTLEKPYGIGMSNAMDEGGATVSQVAPGSNAEASGNIESGYQLIAADGEPVYGQPVNDIAKKLTGKEGPVRLTFFKGSAEYFYGKLGPSSAWLADFLDKLQEY
mmetsp:Transcript_18537/g.38558  ORF Transcript_18537/g.38558 Transcript_18537/m.38558 type:complete len:239 (-) Transcript_18537:242-958(-)